MCGTWWIEKGLREVGGSVSKGGGANKGLGEDVGQRAGARLNGKRGPASLSVRNIGL